MADGLNDTKGSSVAGDAAVSRLFSGGTVLCDGAMGTMLYARGIFINRCYDELNLSHPALVREVHPGHAQGGAWQGWARWGGGCIRGTDSGAGRRWAGRWRRPAGHRDDDVAGGGGAGD